MPRAPNLSAIFYFRLIFEANKELGSASTSLFKNLWNLECWKIAQTRSFNGVEMRFVFTFYPFPSSIHQLACLVFTKLQVGVATFFPKDMSFYIQLLHCLHLTFHQVSRLSSFLVNAIEIAPNAFHHSRIFA